MLILSRFINIVFIFTIISFINLSTAQICPSSAISSPKDNALYLYFPTVADMSFPEYGSGDTSPAEPFNVSDLDAGIGSTAQLRQEIFEGVIDDYCEFNVEVKNTTSTPSPSETRWQIVAIGSDSESLGGGALFGEAQNVDIGDNDPQDYARVWAQSFGDAYGGAGGALAGANSTLARWANAITGTVSHEAAHNYGLSHGNSAPQMGEDPQNNHIMATGSTGLTGEQRAGFNRHFSDTAYEILGHNVGLNTKTVHNWDFINPNSVDAYALRIKILSQANSLTISWFYNGSLSPWTNPTVTNTGATETFQGNLFNVFQLEFNVAKSWANGANGIAPPGVKFHIGTSFTQPDAIIVREVKLLGAGNNELALSPRLFGYDTGTLDMASGIFNLSFFNAMPTPLILQNLVVRFVPRMIDINSMVRDARLVDLSGLPVKVISEFNIQEALEVEEETSINIAKLTDRRHVDITYNPGDNCQRGFKSPPIPDTQYGEMEYCEKGTALSLFPSTYVYIIATVIDPNAHYWDPNQGQFVDGPLESRIFYQLAGIKPDLNKNGIDDLLDIRNGTSVDENGNGIPDEAELYNCCSYTGADGSTVCDASSGSYTFEECKMLAKNAGAKKFNWGQVNEATAEMCQAGGTCGDVQEYLGVTLNKLTTSILGNQLVIQWDTASEENNLGMNLWCAQMQGNQFQEITQLNSELIPSKAMLPNYGALYSSTDYPYVNTNLQKPGVQHCTLEDIDASGQCMLHCDQIDTVVVGDSKLSDTELNELRTKAITLCHEYELAGVCLDQLLAAHQ
ncbi:MAG: hypothetical protein HC877_00125 [Thioploca sp.]|nr:hypothetical protein [Thioploca sp.]